MNKYKVVIRQQNKPSERYHTTVEAAGVLAAAQRAKEEARKVWDRGPALQTVSVELVPIIYRWNANLVFELPDVTAADIMELGMRIEDVMNANFPGIYMDVSWTNATEKVGR